MKRNLAFFITMVLSRSLFGQVGINNETPKATLDVNAKVGSVVAEGIIAPRLTGDQIKDKDNLYGPAQIGTLIYATAPIAPGTTSPKSKNITGPGYFYFDGNLWVKLAIFVAGQDITNDAWTNGTGQVLLGAKSDGTARSVDTDFVALDTGNVGIGTTTPSEKLTLSRGSLSVNLAPDDNVIKLNIGEDGYAYGNRNEDRGIAFSTFSSVNTGLLARITAGDIAGERYLGFQVGRNSLKTDTKLVYMTSAGGGRVGISTETPTNALDVNSTNPLRLRGLQTGATADQILSVDATGVVKKVPAVSTTGFDATNDAWTNSSGVVNMATLADGTTARTNSTQFIFKDSGSATFGSSLTTYPSKLTLVNNATGDPLNDNFEIASFGPTTQLGQAVYPIIDISSAAGTESAPLNFPNSTTTATGIGQIRWNARAGGSKIAVANISASYAGNGTTNVGTMSLSTSGNLAAGITINDNNVGIGTETPTSKFQVVGSFSAPIRSFSGQILESDYTILGTGDVTLPNPVGRTGRIYNIMYDTTNFIVTGNLRLNGASTTSYGFASNYPGITVQSNGSSWIIINERY